MSDISTVHAAYISLIETALPTYVRIPDPYDPEKNASLILDKGYGLGFGPANNTERMKCPQLSIAREFFVVLTNKIVSLENDSNQRGSIEKSLFEDHFALVKAVEADPTLGGAAVITKYVSDGGLEFLNGEQAKHFLIEIVFESEYFESTL